MDEIIKSIQDEIKLRRTNICLHTGGDIGYLESADEVQVTENIIKALDTNNLLDTGEYSILSQALYDRLEKGVKDRSHLTKKVIVDKNGNRRTVYVKSNDNKKTQNPSDKKDPEQKNSSKVTKQLNDILSSGRRISIRNLNTILNANKLTEKEKGEIKNHAALFNRFKEDPKKYGAKNFIQRINEISNGLESLPGDSKFSQDMNEIGWLLNPTTEKMRYKVDKVYGNTDIKERAYKIIDDFNIKYNPNQEKFTDVIKEHLENSNDLAKDRKLKEALYSLDKDRIEYYDNYYRNED